MELHSRETPELYIQSSGNNTIETNPSRVTVGKLTLLGLHCVVTLCRETPGLYIYTALGTNPRAWVSPRDGVSTWVYLRIYLESTLGTI